MGGEGGQKIIENTNHIGSQKDIFGQIDIIVCWNTTASHRKIKITGTNAWKQDMTSWAEKLGMRTRGNIYREYKKIIV